MNKPKITLTTCDSGDWETLTLDTGKTTYDMCVGTHSLSNYYWIELLNKLGYKVEEKCISDDEMEELC